MRASEAPAVLAHTEHFSRAAFVDLNGDGVKDQTDLALWGDLLDGWLANDQEPLFVTEDAFDQSGGPGLSLSEAISLAGTSAYPGPDTIVIAPWVEKLDLSGQLSITSDLTIIGAGSDVLTIDAGGFSRAFLIASGANVTLRDMTITGGMTATGNHGAGISNSGNLTLQRVVLTGNHTGSGGFGGAIFHNGTGTLTIIDSTLSDNSAGFGGALASGATGTISISGSTIGPLNQSTSEGGAIYLGGTTGGITTIVNSTVSGNSAGASAGGIAVAAPSAALSLENVTLAYNTAANVSGSAGGGLRKFNGTATLHNTIAAKNQVGTSQNDIAGGLEDSSSYNLFGVGAGSPTPTGSGNQIGTTGTPLDPKLAPLANYGGLTATHALIETSPAIDKGSNSFGGVYDQRGFSRAYDLPDSNGADGFVDIGAFEASIDTPLVVRFAGSDRNNTPNVNDLSLREALSFSASLAGSERITFAPSTWGVITLGGTNLAITKDVKIVGPGSDKLTIDANAASRVFFVSSGVTAAIEGLTITGGKTAANNHGAGISNSGNVTLRRVVITENETGSGGFGGGVFHSGTGTLTIEESTFSGNSATFGGALASGATGSIMIAGSTFGPFNQSVNEGGAIYLGGSTGGATTIKNSTISGNSAGASAGGIAVAASGAALTVVNSTIAYNTAANISGSAGGGIRRFNGTATLHNTIVALNMLGSGADDVAGGLVDISSYNLFGVGAGSTTPTGPGNKFGTIMSPIDPLLDPLADYGGPTWTHRLQSASLAIDAGENSLATTYDLEFDQRGSFSNIRSRIEDGDGDWDKTIDIGAFERAFADL